MGNLKTTKKVRVALLKQLSKVFEKSDENGKVARNAYKFYAIRSRKSVDGGSYLDGNEVFIDRPNMETRAVSGKEARIPHLKLSDKSYGPLKILRSYEDVAVVDLNGAETPIALDQLSKAPKSRAPPPNLNTVCNNDEIYVPIPVNKPPTEIMEDLDVHPAEETPEKVDPGAKTVV